MILMTWDHASMFFNAERVATDSPAMAQAGAVYSTTQFLLRWITHLCAPSFVFLAGTGLALSYARRRTKGRSESEFDKDLLIRGGLLLLAEGILVRNVAGITMFQVLYAIGVSFWCMIALRRLPIRLLLACSVVWLSFGEAITKFFWNPTGPQPASPWIGATVGVSIDQHMQMLYPAIPWLVIMLMGWLFGNWWTTSQAQSRPRIVGFAGLASLCLFAAVRGINGYGNMDLLREDMSLVQWLHVSKYPPSVAYTCLELGIAGVVLAGFMQWEQRKELSDRHVFTVFGQTALFFYLLHLVLLKAAFMGANAFAIEQNGTGTGAIVWLAVLAMAYPICIKYRAAKQNHPRSWLRYI